MKIRMILIGATLSLAIILFLGSLLTASVVLGSKPLHSVVLASKAASNADTIHSHLTLSRSGVDSSHHDTFQSDSQSVPPATAGSSTAQVSTYAFPNAPSGPTAISDGEAVAGSFSRSSSVTSSSSILTPASSPMSRDTTSPHGADDSRRVAQFGVVSPSSVPVAVGPSVPQSPPTATTAGSASANTPASAPASPGAIAVGGVASDSGTVAGSFNASSWQLQSATVVDAVSPPYPLEYELYQQKYGVDAFNKQMFQRNFAQ